MTLRFSGMGMSLATYLSMAGSLSAAHAQPEAYARPQKLDLLFVVDDSSSMAGEQAALRAQIPKLTRALTTGNRWAGDPEPFRPVRDLHVGVVSSDMGIPGVEFGSCHADGGDDGHLQHVPHPSNSQTCDATYPQYISYQSQYDDVNALANAVSCIAPLGTQGCGIEQPLESAFKALWPKSPPENASVNPYRFISVTEAGTWGRGDVPAAQGGNLGFLRNDQDDPSMIAIVVLTDEDDCSVSKTDHLKPNNQLSEDSPYRHEDINLRCYYHQEFMYDLKNRYLNGLRKLRPGREDLVFFSVIAGVPGDLVDSSVQQNTDFSDSASRDAFYETILNDPRMQAQVDPSTNPGSGTGNLRPSCVMLSPGESSPSVAYPPRRLVELAQEFGEHGMVQSICGDLEPAIDGILNGLARHL